MKKRFRIDERYVNVNMTLSIIIYSFVVPFCIYLSVDNFLRGEKTVGYYALFCAVMTAIAVINLSICKFGKKRRSWLMHLALNIQCIVYWITFFFFLYTGGSNGSSIFLFFLAPPVVFFFFNLFYGVYFCMVFFVIMAVYMNTPLREMGYAFPDVYYSRLPMMYLVNVIMCAMAQYEVVKAKIKQDKALDDARKASEAKTDFLANTSHEIRTPINAVLGMNEMILRESTRAESLNVSDPEVYRGIFRNIRNYSGNVDSAGSSLLSIINDILDFTKIEEGKMEIVEVGYQLSSVLNDISNMIYFRAREKDLIFETEIDENLPDSLYGDVIRLRQILINILGNAVKYTDKGKVTLKLTGKQGGTDQDGRTVIDLTASVSDTGIGIKEENIGKLFGKFERVDLEKNSTKEGTGLGLAITKRLLEMMNGRIEVTSVYGKGSTFTVTIPQIVMSSEPVGNFKEKFERSIEEKINDHKGFRAPGARILIVDDTRMNLIVATEFLKYTKMSIDTAGGGKEAIELALSQKYDVILMDQRMPEMDGAETLRELRKHKEGPNIDTTVICLTADAVIGARERYLSMGFDDYLTKPINSAALEGVLKKYLPPEKVILGDDPLPEEEPLSKEDLISLIDAGIDVSKGIAYCGGDETFYDSMLLEYLRSYGEKKEKLGRYLAEGNLKDYSVNVHSLKSTSATIGAGSLQSIAMKLEKASLAGDTETLKAEHPGMMEEYDRIIAAIRAYMPDADESPAGDDDEILEFSPE